MRYFGWILALLLVCMQLGAQGDTRQRPKDYTWDELKRVQQEERKDFLDAQKNALTTMQELQKGAMEALKAESFTSPTDIKELSKEHSEERKAIMKAHGDERNKLAETHGSERKQYASIR